MSWNDAPRMSPRSKSYFGIKAVPIPERSWKSPLGGWIPPDTLKNSASHIGPALLPFEIRINLLCFCSLILFLLFQLIQANNDPSTVVRYNFITVFEASKIKFRPQGWYAHVAMRVEAYGYQAPGKFFSSQIMSITRRLCKKWLLAKVMTFMQLLPHP